MKNFLLYSIQFLFVLSFYFIVDNDLVLGQKTNFGIDNITKITLIANDDVILKVSPDNPFHPGGIWYKAMTYNGTLPGPAIHVNQGDILEVTLINSGDNVHSMNFHAAYGFHQSTTGPVKPGEKKTLVMKLDYPGAYLYHCDGDNLNGIWEHMSSGMYGGIIVHPVNETPAKEFDIVFGEIYNNADEGFFKGSKEIGSFDFNKFLSNKPDLILTNGMAYKYMPRLSGQFSSIILNEESEIFHANEGELTRWYIINAGPRGYLSFNFAGTLIDETQDNIIMQNNQSKSLKKIKIYETIIPPGSGSVIEVTFPEDGTYVGNDHDIGRLISGAGFVVEVKN